jgi:alpha-mannosidase
MGADGTKLTCFVKRPPVADIIGYILPPVSEMSGRDHVADRNSDRFGNMVEETVTYLNHCKKICHTNFNVYMHAWDKSRISIALRVREAWNNIFCTPRIHLTSSEPMAKKLIEATAFPRDIQEGEQPTWGPCIVAGFRLTLAFQKASYALAAAEKAAAIDMIMNAVPYPSDELKAAWINILNEQQHEQLGFAEADATGHAGDVIRRGTALAYDITRCATMRIASRIRFQKLGKPVTVFNFLNWKRRDIVEIENENNALILDSRGARVPHEISNKGKLRFMAEADALGYNTYYLAPPEGSPGESSDLQAGVNVIENAFFRLEVNPKTGCVEKLFDKELQFDTLKAKGKRLPFELVVHEDNNEGYCTFWPTGRKWCSSDYPNAKVNTSTSSLSAKLVVNRGLFDAEGESCFGNSMQIEFELPTQTKRLDVKITLDWNNKAPGREVRLFVPLPLKAPAISYDTLFATSDYDEDLPKRQHDYAYWMSWVHDSKEVREKYYATHKDNQDDWYSEINSRMKKKDCLQLMDWRNVTRFVSAFDTAENRSVTMTVPHGLLRVEDNGVSFTLIEDQTTSYVHQLNSMKGRHVFHTSLTSQRGNWESNKAWRFGWEHRGCFNPMIAVVPEKRYSLLDERGTFFEIDGENLVLTALKKSHTAEDLIVRVYDASGKGDQLGIRLTGQYLGHRPVKIEYARHQHSINHSGPDLTDTPLIPLDIIGAHKTNLLEDCEQKINLNKLRTGRVQIPRYKIFTTRLIYEKPKEDVLW